MPYDISFGGGSADELRRFRVFERRQIVEEIENQLRNEPTVSTPNRKCLKGELTSELPQPQGQEAGRRNHNS